MGRAGSCFRDRPPPSRAGNFLAPRFLRLFTREHLPQQARRHPENVIVPLSTVPGEKQVTTSPFPWTGPRAVTSTSPSPSGPARCPPVPVQPAPPSPVRTGHALPQPAELWPFYHCSRRLLASSPHHLSARILRRIRRSLPGGALRALR